MAVNYMNNPNCDGGHCRSNVGAVRVVPYAGGNLILCQHCFNVEINYRHERNLELEGTAKFDLPTWDSLKVYDAGESAGVAQ